MTNEYLHRAEALVELKRWREAIPLLTKANSIDERDAVPLCLLGLCFFELKEIDKAFAYAEKAIGTDPEHEGGHRLKSHLLTNQKRFKEALHCIKEAARLAPDDPAVICHLVDAYLNRQLLSEAQRTAQMLLRIAPDSAETFFVLGRVSQRLDNSEDAEKQFREALKLNPNYAEARNQLAIAVLNQSDTPIERQKQTKENEALNHFAESVKIDPNNDFVLGSLKESLDNSGFYFGMIWFSPLFLLGIYVSPFLTAPISLFICAIFVTSLIKNKRRRRKLSPEMQNLFKIRNYSAYLREQTAKFGRGGSFFYKNIRLPVCIASIIAGLFYFFPVTSANTFLLYFLKLAFIANYFWIFQRIFKYTGNEQ